MNVLCARICTLSLLLGLLCSPSTQAASSGRPEDECRALPNISAPPARLAPLSSLPPLPETSEGTIRRVNTGERKMVALTFDLCELAVVTTGYDADIIDFLREKQLSATLFMGGKWMRTHRERTLEVMADPQFEIGNHAWSHGNFGIMSEPAMLEQIRWTQAQYELLREELLATGQDVSHLPPCPTLFRLPYGRCTDKALHLLAQEGLQVIQWDSLGEVGSDNSVPGLEERVVKQVRPGSILLFHSNKVPKGSAAILRRTVALLEAQGYTFVTVSALLHMGDPERTHNGYFSVPGDNLSLDKNYGVDGTGRKK